MVTAAELARVSYYDDDAMRGLEAGQLLAIDDLGVEFIDKSGMFLSLLDTVLNARYSQRRKTIITSNLGPEAFRERYGERIADRVREAGAFIGVKGESLRRAA